MRKYIYLLILTFFSIFANDQQIDSCTFYRMQRDTLLHKNYVANKKINKFMFYENICIKNPSQIKFLKSWQTRTKNIK